VSCRGIGRAECHLYGTHFPCHNLLPSNMLWFFLPIARARLNGHLTARLPAQQPGLAAFRSADTIAVWGRWAADGSNASRAAQVAQSRRRKAAIPVVADKPLVTDLGGAVGQTTFPDPEPQLRSRSPLIPAARYRCCSIGEAPPRHPTRPPGEGKRKPPAMKRLQGRRHGREPYWKP